MHKKNSVRYKKILCRKGVVLCNAPCYTDNHVRMFLCDMYCIGGCGHEDCNTPEGSHCGDDLRFTLEKYPAVQLAADDDPGAGGAVQPQRCGHRRQVCVQHLCGPGLCGLHHHAGHAVHGTADRPGRRCQCGRGPRAGYGQRRGRGAHHPLLLPDLSGDGRADMPGVCFSPSPCCGCCTPRRNSSPARCCT